MLLSSITINLYCFGKVVVDSCKERQNVILVVRRTGVCAGVLSSVGAWCDAEQGFIDIYWFSSYLRQFISLFLPQYINCGQIFITNGPQHSEIKER